MENVRNGGDYSDTTKLRFTTTVGCTCHKMEIAKNIQSIGLYQKAKIENDVELSNMSNMI